MPLDRAAALALLPDVFVSRRRRSGRYVRHVRPVGGCWLWQGAMHRGVPRITPCRGTQLTVRHIVWLALRGPLPGLREVIGTACGRSSCVAPDHLVLDFKGMGQRRMDDDTVRAVRNAGKRMPAQAVAERFAIKPIAAHRIMTGYNYCDSPWADGETGPAWVDGRSLDLRRTPAPTRARQPYGERQALHAVHS